MLVLLSRTDVLHGSFCFSTAQQGKKPTKVAVRKMAREARWQQQVEESGAPFGSPEDEQGEERLQEIKQRREKAEK